MFSIFISHPVWGEVEGTLVALISPPTQVYIIVMCELMWLRCSTWSTCYCLASPTTQSCCKCRPKCTATPIPTPPPWGFSSRNVD